MLESVKSGISYLIDLDEIRILLDAIWLTPSLIDRRFIAVFFVILATYFWTTMEAMASARADAENQRLQVILGCANRPRLKSLLHASLFPSNSAIDVFKNVRSKGKTPLHLSPDIYTGADGCIWRSSVAQVLVVPVRSELHLAVRSRVRRDLDLALLRVKQGGRVKLDNLRHLFLFVDFDDSDCFINFFDSAEFRKRHYVLTLSETLNANCNTELRYCSFSAELGKQQVLINDFESDDFFFSFALILAHLSPARNNTFSNQLPNE